MAARRAGSRPHVPAVDRGQRASSCWCGRSDRRRRSCRCRRRAASPLSRTGRSARRPTATAHRLSRRPLPGEARAVVTRPAGRGRRRRSARLASPASSAASESNATKRPSADSDGASLSGPAALRAAESTETRLVCAAGAIAHEDVVGEVAVAATRSDDGEANATIAPSARQRRAEPAAGRSRASDLPVGAAQRHPLGHARARSRTKTSGAKFVSPRTRLRAADTNATTRPSADIAGRRRVAARLRAAAGDRHPHGLPGSAITDEDVGVAVRVAGNEVRQPPR